MIDRRRFLLAAASLPAARASAASPVEFARVTHGRKFVFPADHGAHPLFRTEWWYATGWLDLPNGNPLGFQITFFRVRTGIGEKNPSAFAPSQLIFSHAAIADPQLGRLRHEQRAARTALGRAGFAKEEANVWIGDWRWQQRGERYIAMVKSTDFSYELSLTAHAPPILNGDNGFSAKSPDPIHSSYYYSQPQLAVNGSVMLSGVNHKVAGTAWLDHEWSSEYMPAGAQGWDWVGLNLDDGGSLMAFQMRGAMGTAIWSNATFKPAQGETRTFSYREVQFEPHRRWRSARTGISYPVEWTLRVGARQFALQPLIDDQELDSRRTTGAVYWEGAVRVMDGSRSIGRGYLEMTGYGETMRMG